MRILLVNKFYYPRGGDCIYTINLESLLKKHGHETAIFAMDYHRNIETPWRLVAIAHNGTGTATISSPNKITFPNNKCTDTFYICEDFSVSDNSEFDLTLKRAVAMFRFVVEDAFPENIHQMKFYYTGGSSTFDATTGYGCVNSKQTEYREINDEMGNNEKQFDLFTFPHAEEDTLKMTITALSSTDVTIKVQIAENKNLLIKSMVLVMRK